MKSIKEVEKEIKKLRMVFHSKTFSEKARDSAWAMMLALQWASLENDVKSLSPMELSGITMQDSIALNKKCKRT